MPIVTTPNPLLRQQTRLVQPEEIPGLSPLIADMFDTLASAGGVGLAAPQVGVDANLFVVDVDGSKHVFINPVVIEASPETDTQEEGCLSMPGITLKVPRSTSIKVMYRDGSGEQKITDMRDGWARIFLHEFDHLQGILMDDRVGPVSRMMAMKKAAKRRRVAGRMRTA